MRYAALDEGGDVHGRVRRVGHGRHVGRLEPDHRLQRPQIREGKHLSVHGESGTLGRSRLEGDRHDAFNGDVEREQHLQALNVEWEDAELRR